MWLNLGEKNIEDVKKDVAEAENKLESLLEIDIKVLTDVLSKLKNVKKEVKKASLGKKEMTKENAEFLLKRISIFEKEILEADKEETYQHTSEERISLEKIRELLAQLIK